MGVVWSESNSRLQATKQKQHVLQLLICVASEFAYETISAIIHFNHILKLFIYMQDVIHSHSFWKGITLATDSL